MTNPIEDAIAKWDIARRDRLRQLLGQYADDAGLTETVLRERFIEDALASLLALGDRVAYEEEQLLLYGDPSRPEPKGILHA